MKKTYKASILGALLILAGLYVITMKEAYNEYMIGGLIVSGILLFFVPNKFINLLEKVIIGRVLIDKDKTEQP